MKQIIIDHLKTAGISFLSTFLVVFGTSLKSLGTVEISGSLIGGLAVAALGVAIKEIFERSVSSPTLGGRRSR